MSATVRINPETHVKLKAICDRTGETIPSVLEKAIEVYRRQQFLEEASRAYGALKANPKAWKEELAERALWDATLSDGLEDE